MERAIWNSIVNILVSAGVLSQVCSYCLLLAPVWLGLNMFQVLGRTLCYVTLAWFSASEQRDNTQLNIKKSALEPLLHHKLQFPPTLSSSAALYHSRRDGCDAWRRDACTIDSNQTEICLFMIAVLTVVEAAGDDDVLLVPCSSVPQCAARTRDAVSRGGPEYLQTRSQEMEEAVSSQRSHIPGQEV
uniref:Uncharacterized protein n=1 Tax=Timema cristinae TaxID=61476 RepID=A0A7R9H069_TIMCR|nr:unnamed protein product [Timema cristinae]